MWFYVFGLTIRITNPILDSIIKGIIIHSFNLADSFGSFYWFTFKYDYLPFDRRVIIV
jgi:hypothetical protein